MKSHAHHRCCLNEYEIGAKKNAEALWLSILWCGAFLVPRGDSMTVGSMSHIHKWETMTNGHGGLWSGFENLREFNSM